MTTLKSNGLAPDALSLLRLQASLYAQLELLASRQRNLVRREDTGPLLSILADRRRLSAELLDVSTRLAPIRANWRGFRKGLAPNQQAEADRLVEEAESRLRRVIDGDEHDARLLAARRACVAERLSEARTQRDAFHAYLTPAVGGTRFNAWDEDPS